MGFQIFLLLTSFVILYVGAEVALSNSEKIGQYFKLSPLVIGIILIGMGTSLPEFFVGHLAALRNASDMAMGNIIGSNIANLFVVLGLLGILTPIRLDVYGLKKQLILHLVLYFLLTFVLYFDTINWWLGGILLCFFAYYLVYTYKAMEKPLKVEIVDKETLTEGAIEGEASPRRLVLWILGLLFGFFLLYLGAEWLVRSGRIICLYFGVSQYVISAIFLAFGTSFPEFMTSIVAFYKKKDLNLITGNVIGSNIFNVAFVLGSLGPYNFPNKRTYWVELAVLFLASIYLIGLNKKKKDFARASGVFFLLLHCGMIYYWSTRVKV